MIWLLHLEAIVAGCLIGEVLVWRINGWLERRANRAAPGRNDPSNEAPAAAE